MGPKQVLEEWFRRVWKEEDTSAIHEMFEPDGSATGLEKADIIGPEKFEQFQRALLGVAANVDIQIERHMVDGEWISALCRLKATKRSDGTPLEMVGHVYGRIVDGKIVHADNNFDFISFFEQAGYLPENTLGRCLQCEVVG